MRVDGKAIGPILGFTPSRHLPQSALKRLYIWAPRAAANAHLRHLVSARIESMRRNGGAQTAVKRRRAKRASTA